ncbi:sulfurtransferase [Bathymodiolus septemdierum thioautotrophic gill symbiont]|nr:rhodanese-like domain-containing protein [Bathymodiolus septemdierum thioautotrophic gill symbiont]
MRILISFILVLISQFALANRDFLIDSDWLSERIEDKNIRVLEVRYHPHRYFTIGHIPGAVQVQRFKDLGDNNANPIMRFPSKKAFEDTLRRWGINNDSTIVIYDDSGTALASRVYFLLELYGFNMNQVKILNGGSRAWNSFEDMTTETTRVSRGNVVLQEKNPNLFIEWQDVYGDVVSERDKNIVLLDARPHKMYTGEVIKHSILAGHIPGAINIVSMKGISAQEWIDEKGLIDLYAQIPKDKTIYVYCHDGFRMSLAYLQLKSLGYKHVKLYNGGWSHWGNRLTLPTVEDEAPYAGDYEL